MADIEFGDDENKNRETIRKILGPEPACKGSKLSLTHITNYLLSLSLMKTVIMRFLNSNRSSFDNVSFEIDVGKQLEWLTEIESQITVKKYNTPFKRRNSESQSIPHELSISFLVIQHKQEVLDQMFDLDQVLKETLNKGFMEMIMVAIFEPLLQNNVPDLNTVTQPK